MADPRLHIYKPYPVDFASAVQGVVVFCPGGAQPLDSHAMARLASAAKQRAHCDGHNLEQGWKPYGSVASLLGIADEMVAHFLSDGTIFCPKCGAKQGAGVGADLREELERGPDDAKVSLWVVLPQREDALSRRLEYLAKQGFEKIRVDGEPLLLSELPGAVLADEVLLLVTSFYMGEKKVRIDEQVRWAQRLGQGVFTLEVEGCAPHRVKIPWQCVECGEVLPAIDAHLLSPRGEGCEECFGLGQRVSVAADTCIVNPQLSLAQGVVAPWKNRNAVYYHGILKRLCGSGGIDMEAPWSLLGEAARAMILFGSGHDEFEGIVHDLETRFVRALSLGRQGEPTLTWLYPYLEFQICIFCEGTGLSSDASALRISGLCMADVYRSKASEFSLLVKKIGADDWLSARLELAQKLGLNSDWQLLDKTVLLGRQKMVLDILGQAGREPEWLPAFILALEQEELDHLRQAVGKMAEHSQGMLVIEDRVSSASAETKFFFV